MLKRWVARNLMLGREQGEAFPSGEHLYVPPQNTATDSYYFFIRSDSGATLVSRLACRQNMECEFWLGIHLPNQSPWIWEGISTQLNTPFPSIEGLAFMPNSDLSWIINIDLPQFNLKGSLRFTPTTGILDFAKLRDKNQIASSLAKMPWNAASFKALKSMKTEHIEQAGIWNGELTWNENVHSMVGVGARDHSRGERNWKRWNSHCWFTGFDSEGSGFNLSLIDFKGLPTLRAGYISIHKNKAVPLTDGPDSPIKLASGEFQLSGGHLNGPVNFKTQNSFEFTMDGSYRIVEGFGSFYWQGKQYEGILERGYTLNP